MIKSLLKINPLRDLSFFLLFPLIIVIGVVVTHLMIFVLFTISSPSLEGKFLAYLPKSEPASVTQIYLTYDQTQESKTRIKVGDKEYQDWQEAYQKVLELSKEAQEKNQPISFAIDGADNVPWQEIITAIDICRRAGIEDSFLQTEYR